MHKPVLPDVGNQRQCSICLVSCSGFDNFQEHINTVEHAMKVQKINNDLSQSVSGTFELKNKLKQEVGSTTSPVSPMNTTVASAECKLRQKQFSGPEPYQQHLATADHKTRCGYSLNQITQQDRKDSSKKNEKVADGLPLTNMVPQPFAKCEICQMQFSEAAFYQTHLASDDHKKKVGHRLLGNAFLSENRSAFKCDICSMSFTGPVPYQQHLNSIGHTKKIRAAESPETLAAKTSLSRNSMSTDSNIISEQSCVNDLQNWFCDICKKQCSGPIPYNSHITSRDHLKNLRIQKMQKNMRKIKESGLFPYVGID